MHGSGTTQLPEVHFFMAQVRASISKLSNLLHRKPLLLGVLLVFATLLLYLPVVHHEFLNRWDDNVYITGNAHVQSGLSVSGLSWAFTTLQPFYWQPLTWISDMVDCQLFGLNSGAHHYVNVLLHATNALLLFLLLHRATGAVWRSFFVAALFALHPMNVETVAWAAERKSLLNALFTLVTLATYGWYVRRPSWKRYTAVIAAFLLSLMCKPVAVTIPLILLFVDYWPLKRYEDLPFAKRWGRLLLEKLPLILISAGISALTIVGESASDTVASFSVLPMSTRLENAVISYAAYVGTALWPAKLSPFYPHPFLTLGPSLPMGEVVASSLVLAGITALIYLYRARFALMGWLFFLTTLVPMIGIVQTGRFSRQDHFTYIPCIGLFILAVWGLSDAIDAMPIKRTIPIVVSLCLLTGYAAATARYLPYWQNDVKLFGRARTVAGEPHPWLELLYGNALFDAGRTDEALEHYKESCVLGPSDAYCHCEIANVMLARRQFRSAIDEYQFALTLKPNKDLALVCLNKSAQAMLELEEYGAAEGAVADALRIDPTNATALSLRGQLLDRRK